MWGDLVKYAKRFNQKYGELNTWLLIVLVLTFTLRLILVRAVIEGESMANTYHEGDSVWVVKNLGVGYSRDDIIVFDNPYGFEQDAWYNLGELTHFTQPIRYIKRVVAVEGDSVTIDGDLVEVNGQVINEAGNGIITPEQAVKKEFVVGPNQYLVLGDNRKGSMDSRHFGVIDLSMISGRIMG